jgi:hypothetical protein
MRATMAADLVLTLTIYARSSQPNVIATPADTDFHFPHQLINTWILRYVSRQDQISIRYWNISNYSVQNGSENHPVHVLPL